MVRLGMQVAFGRVRRKTAPTGPGVNLTKERKIERPRRGYSKGCNVPSFTMSAFCS